MKRLLKELVVTLIAALIVGCNAEEIRDWDDDKLLVLRVLYDHHNRTHLKSSTYMAPAQIMAKVGIDDRARIALLLRHVVESGHVTQKTNPDSFLITSPGRGIVRVDRHEKELLSWNRWTAILAATSGSITVIIGTVLWFFVRAALANKRAETTDDANDDPLGED